jgi:hypothetical protein
MSASVRWNGLHELVQALTNAPQDIRDDAMPLIRQATEATAAEVRSAYPSVTGTLRARVQVSYPSSDVLVGIVRSASPHSHLYEFGTARRSDNGKNRGTMPAAKRLVPIAQRNRATMFERLLSLMKSKGYHLG